MKKNRRATLGKLLLCAALPALLASCGSLHSHAHPLTGKLWDVSAQRFVEPEQLMERAANARYVLLGEIHDNVDHHRLQLRVMQEMVKRGKRPALVMEQYDVDQQAQINAARKDMSRPDGLSELMRKSWNRALYEPLVDLALSRDLPIVAANTSREQLRTISRSGFDALGENAATRLGLDDTWTPERQAQLAQDVVAGHCGKAPDQVVQVITKSQRVRDAVMADVMLPYEQNGVVATIGNGHARRDMGVPLYLAARSPSATVLSVGLVQVDAPTNPSAYANGPLGPLFDYIWFTARAQRHGVNPCDSMPAMKAPQ